MPICWPIAGGEPLQSCRLILSCIHFAFCVSAPAYLVIFLSRMCLGLMPLFLVRIFVSRGFGSDLGRWGFPPKGPLPSPYKRACRSTRGVGLVSSSASLSYGQVNLPSRSPYPSSPVLDSGGVRKTADPWRFLVDTNTMRIRALFFGMVGFNRGIDSNPCCRDDGSPEMTVVLSLYWKSRIS